LLYFGKMQDGGLFSILNKFRYKEPNLKGSGS
jgi:hypothetical protein